MRQLNKQQRNSIQPNLDLDCSASDEVTIGVSSALLGAVVHLHTHLVGQRYVVFATFAHAAVRSFGVGGLPSPARLLRGTSSLDQSVARKDGASMKRKDKEKETMKDVTDQINADSMSPPQDATATESVTVTDHPRVTSATGLFGGFYAVAYVSMNNFFPSFCLLDWCVRISYHIQCSPLPSSL